MPRSIRLADLPLVARRRRPLHARFLERPNRFTALVSLRGGARALAHLPNPGRLTGVVSPGCPALLDGPFPAPRTLSYTMVAARQSATWIGTNTTYANLVFPRLLAGGLFPEFDACTPRAEVRHGRSRFDFRVGETLVEVKSVTLVRGDRGLFPDAITARGARHCHELRQVAERGAPTAIVFVAQRHDVESVEPEDGVDPAFGEALRAAARAGVIVLACALDLQPSGAREARRIPVRL
ncbi:MAG: DNA/RNA nuclease SfsA [Acidobacteriota bacterium]